MATVTLDRLTKSYERGHEPAADNVSLDIAEGEFMVFLGPSGCGKTTTLRMIAGLESITAGTVSIDDKVVNDTPAKDRDIAMVFQSYALYPHMSVRNNLAFGLKRRSVSRKEIETRIHNVASILKLDGLLDRKPHALSGGQRQRVALGRAIVRDPKVFLFDEPLSNLDAALRVSTRAEIASLHRRLGATMIYVTHDQVEAMTLGTRICIMNQGRVMQVGSPLSVYRNPANTFVAGFLGNPPMNLLPATLAANNAGPALLVGGHPLPLPNRLAAGEFDSASVTFGIRPEHIDVGGSASGEDTILEGRVIQIESLGAETMATLELNDGNEKLIARLGGEVELSLEQPVRAHLDMDYAHLFDKNGNTLIKTDN